MEKMKIIHQDELPERCRYDIRRFFEKPNCEHEAEPDCIPILYRNPEEYIILASKERNGTNYLKWQASFLKKSDINSFKQYHPDYLNKYFRVQN